VISNMSNTEFKVIGAGVVRDTILPANGTIELQVVLEYEYSPSTDTIAYIGNANQPVSLTDAQASALVIDRDYTLKKIGDVNVEMRVPDLTFTKLIRESYYVLKLRPLRTPPESVTDGAVNQFDDGNLSSWGVDKSRFTITTPVTINIHTINDVGVVDYIYGFDDLTRNIAIQLLPGFDNSIGVDFGTTVPVDASVRDPITVPNLAQLATLEAVILDVSERKIGDDFTVKYYNELTGVLISINDIGMRNASKWKTIGQVPTEGTTSMPLSDLSVYFNFENEGTPTPDNPNPPPTSFEIGNYTGKTLSEALTQFKSDNNTPAELFDLFDASINEYRDSAGAVIRESDANQYFYYDSELYTIISHEPSEIDLSVGNRLEIKVVHNSVLSAGNPADGMVSRREFDNRLLLDLFKQRFDTSLHTVTALELTESDRFLQYRIIADDGNSYLSTNYVDGGVLNQISNEIDQLGSIVVKMYELVDDLSIKDLVHFSKIFSNGFTVDIDLTEYQGTIKPITLNPNWQSEIENGQTNTFSSYKSFDDLTLGNTATQSKIIDYYLSEKNSDKEINVNYTNFNNFIKFSSAEERLINFRYKLKELEQLTTSRSAFTSISTTELTRIDEKIRLIKISFDGYESFLYDKSGMLFIDDEYIFESDAVNATWPRSGATLYSVDTPEATQWFNVMSTIAQDFDARNVDSLRNNTPSFIRDNADNENYILFVDMLGQMYDDIWLYVTELNNLYDWQESPFRGLSSDLSTTLIEAYGNTLDIGFSEKDVWEYILGTDTTESPISNDVSFNFQNKQRETARKLLTNLPFLLKHKGTEKAIRGLVASYGIPASTLFIKEFGTFQTPSALQSVFRSETSTRLIRFDTGDTISSDDDVASSLNTIEVMGSFTNTSSAGEIFFTATTSTAGSQLTLASVPDSNIGGFIRATLTNGNVSFIIESSVIPTLYDDHTDAILTNVVFQKVGATAYQLSLHKFNQESESFIEDDVKFVNNTISELDSVFDDIDAWEFGNQYSGNLVELRVWSTEVSISDIKEHTKYPISVKITDPLQIPTALLFRVDTASNNAMNNAASNVLPNLVFNPTYPTTIDCSGLAAPNFQRYTRLDSIDVTNIGSDILGNNKVRHQGLGQRLTGNVLTPKLSSTEDIITSVAMLETSIQITPDALGRIVEMIRIEYRDAKMVETTLSIDTLEEMDQDRVYSTTITHLPGTLSINIIRGSGTVTYTDSIPKQVEVVLEAVNDTSNLELTTQMVDSSKLVIGFSPTDITNEIILSHFGSTDLLDSYGNPLDAYASEYAVLQSTVDAFFADVQSNKKVSFFLQYIRNFDKTLFDNIRKFVPERSDLTTSIFIEPHFLNRSKAPRIGASELTEAYYAANPTDTFIEVGGASDYVVGVIESSSEVSGSDTSIGNEENPIVAYFEQILGDVIDVSEPNALFAIINEDDIESFISQDTNIIILNDGFESQALHNNKIDGTGIIRVRDAFGELFEFKVYKFDYSDEMAQIHVDIAGVVDGSSQYQELAREYRRLVTLHGRFFLYKSTQTALSNSIQVFASDFPDTDDDVRDNTRPPGDGGGVDEDDTNPVITIRVTNTRTLVTDPDGDVKLTVR